MADPAKAMVDMIFLCFPGFGYLPQTWGPRAQFSSRAVVVDSIVLPAGGGLVVKRPGVLSKVQMLNLVLGVGVFSLLPT